MPTLQKINLGTPPAGKDGESTRAGFVKMNANVDVLSMLVALGYALITDNTTLTPDQVGTRYGINIADPGKSITIPLASSVPVNACLQFFNVGSAVTVATQGNDGTQIRTLNKGDWATYISDGVKYWHVAERGKMLSDEIVGGNLTVGGRVLLGGASDDGSTALQVKGTASIGKFLSRPTFADNVPWDSGNFDPNSKQPAGNYVTAANNSLRLDWTGSNVVFVVDGHSQGRILTESWIAPDAVKNFGFAGNDGDLPYFRKADTQEVVTLMLQRRGAAEYVNRPVRSNGYIEWQTDIGAVGTNYFTSDARYKENIKPTQVDPLALINALKFYEFDYDEAHGGYHVEHGVLAQQAAGVAPWLVNKLGDGTLSPDATRLLTIALHAIQRLSEEVDALKRERTVTENG
ncbi:tail fiber domain-containing protein [Burkholderia multivorans]|uniref:tail fiber domain-containing protein n=1 Tax=Burkholderia multivorans TaxID=87883 RepID=UPI0030C6FAC7